MRKTVDLLETKLASGSLLQKKLSRRTWLRNAVALMSLPSLNIFESVSAATSATPQNLLVYYFPNGRVPEFWVPTKTAAGVLFPEHIKSLQPFANRVLALKNLNNTAPASSPGAAHAMGTGTILTSTTIPNLSKMYNNISIDQAIAGSIGTQSRFKSLQFSAGEPGPCDVGGSPCAYTQSVSWAGPATPMAPVIDPLTAFNQMFSSSVDGLSGARGTTRQQSLISVVDTVFSDGVNFGKELGADDRRSLDSFFTGVNEVEKRLKGAKPSCAPANTPAKVILYQDRVEVFNDLIALALSCGQTKVVSFMIEFGLSGRSHDFLNAPGGHHSLSHDGSPEGRKRLGLVEGWQADKLASMLNKLSKTPGMKGGTLLDETLVLAIPSMGFGGAHEHHKNTPFLFGGDGAIKTNGQLLDMTGKLMADLHVTLLDTFRVQGNFGLGGKRWGDDGTTALPGVMS